MWRGGCRELGRTQGGNNNAYCQDNEISWINWTANDAPGLLQFVQRLLDLRRKHPVFRRRHFFQGRPLNGAKTKDIVWLRPDGEEMTDHEWNDGFARCLGAYLAGDAIADTDQHGHPIVDENFLILLNAHHDEVPFRFPALATHRWRTLIDTARADDAFPDQAESSDAGYPLQGRSLVLFIGDDAAKGAPS